jgi:hypothetical protein
MLRKTPDSGKEKSNKSSSLTTTALQALTPLAAIAGALRAILELVRALL